MLDHCDNPVHACHIGAFRAWINWMQQVAETASWCASRAYCATLLLPQSMLMKCTQYMHTFRQVRSWSDLRRMILQSAHMVSSFIGICINDAKQAKESPHSDKQCVGRLDVKWGGT
jgi:hypothetical protein